MLVTFGNYQVTSTAHLHMNGMGSPRCMVVAARVFAFLSGPPDYGAGQLDTRRYGEQYASKGEDADRALLPEQTSYYKDLVMLLCGLLMDISLTLYINDI